MSLLRAGSFLLVVLSGCTRIPGVCERLNLLPGQQPEEWNLACRIPGYGGSFLEPGEGAPDAHLVVYLRDLADAERARGHLPEAYRWDLRGTRTVPVVFRQGRYDVHQLQRGRARLQPLHLPQTVFVGIAFDRNRLVIGLSDLRAQPHVLRGRGGPGFRQRPWSSSAPTRSSPKRSMSRCPGHSRRRGSHA